MDPTNIQPRVCPLCAMVSAARPGENGCIALLEKTVVMLGENQGCEGWCVCVLREHVEHLDTMHIVRQALIFAEVARVARAIRACFPTTGTDGGPPRINYECLGNIEPHAHWHVIPRHADDPSPRATVWGWSPEALRGRASDARRAQIARTIGENLARVAPRG